MGQAEQRVLQEAARELGVNLGPNTVQTLKEVPRLIEDHPPFDPDLNMWVTRIWFVELEGKYCFVRQGIQKGEVVFVATR